MTGHEVATSFDGKLAYVPIYGDSSVGEPGTDGKELVVIDIGSCNVVQRFEFGHGVAGNRVDGLGWASLQER